MRRLGSLLFLFLLSASSAVEAHPTQKPFNRTCLNYEVAQLRQQLRREQQDRAQLQKAVTQALRAADILQRANKVLSDDLAEMGQRHRQETSRLQARVDRELTEQQKAVNRSVEIRFLIDACLDYRNRQLETAIADEATLNSLVRLGPVPDLVGRLRRSLQERVGAEERLARAIKRAEGQMPETSTSPH